MTRLAAWEEILRRRGNATAIIDRDRAYSYRELSESVERWCERLEESGLRQGDVVAIHADYSFEAITLFFALAELGAIVVPIISEVAQEVDKRLRLAEADWVLERDDGTMRARKIERQNAHHCLLEKVRERGHSGLVLFSSGSTGEPKAMLHDLDVLLGVYEGKGVKPHNILVFLTFDHIGGIDTMLRALSVGGTLTIPDARTPEAICQAVANHRVEVLPASPTFINLLLLSGLHRRYDLGSLKIVAFGAEPMPAPLLKRVAENFPGVKLQQKFGTSETNAIRVRNEEDNALYFKIDDSNVEYKVVDGELWLKSRTQVLGYLNAPMDGFTEDGWFKTGDMVEMDEKGRMRIVGRDKEVINVGGEKVFPSEVEAVLLQMPEIDDVMVYGEPNAITGEGVSADIVASGEIDRRGMKKAIRKFCKEKLDGYKVPSKINLVDRTAFGERFKKIRRR